MKASWLRLLLFGIASVAAFAFGFLAHSVAEAKELVRVWGYYVIALTTLWWVIALAHRSAEIKAWWRALDRRELRLTGAIIAALCVVAFAVFPYSYKILYDELVLQATAWNMHYFREIGTAVRAYEIDGVFTSLYVYLDKRPYFFAFLLSLLHDLTGFREANAYLLNTLLHPVVLALFYVLARRVAGHRAAVAALICFGASALLAQNANGAGMELINLAMLLLTVLVAADYLAEPNEARLTLLLLTTILLAQSRYESSLYVGPAALAVLEGWRRAGRIILPAAALLAPIMLIPRALHNTYLSGTPLLWELRETEGSRFGFNYLVENSRHAVLYFLEVSKNYLNSWWLAIVGLPAAAFCAWLIARSWRGWPNAPAITKAVVVFSGAVTGNLLLLMFYYWGQLDDPIVSRLALPFYAVLGLAVAYCGHRLEVRFPGRHALAILIVGALAAYLGFGLRTAGHHTTVNLLATEMEIEGRIVAAMPDKSRLIITNKSVLAWIMRRIPAIAIDRARAVGEQVRINMENGTFQEVLVMQLLRPTGPDGNFVVDPSDQLPSIYVLEPVVERHIGARILRISRLVQVNPPPKAEPARPELDRGAQSAAIDRNADPVL